MNLTTAGEGIADTWFDEKTGATYPTIYLNSHGSFNVTGVNGSGEDIFTFVAESEGEPTKGKYDNKPLLDGSAFGLPANAIDGFSIRKSEASGPSAPTGVTADAGDSVISIDWNDNPESDIASYSLKRGTTASGPYTEIASVQRSNYTDLKVQNGTTYYYVVTAINNAKQESALSIEVKGTPNGNTPVEKRIAFDGLEAYGWNGGKGWIGAWKKTGNVKKVKKLPFKGKKYARLVTGKAMLERSVDISKATNPMLRFVSRSRSFEKGDEAIVKVSADGKSYTNMMVLTPQHSDNKYQTYEVPLSNFSKSTNLRIIFESKMNNKKDYWYLDNIEIYEK